MKIVVIGGSGLIGSNVVKKLRESGHEAVAASPSSGVNTITGEGLAEALWQVQRRRTTYDYFETNVGAGIFHNQHPDGARG